MNVDFSETSDNASCNVIPVTRYLLDAPILVCSKTPTGYSRV